MVLVSSSGKLKPAKGIPPKPSSSFAGLFDRLLELLAPFVRDVVHTSLPLRAGAFLLGRESALPVRPWLPRPPRCSGDSKNAPAVMLIDAEYYDSPASRRIRCHEAFRLFRLWSFDELSLRRVTFGACLYLVLLGQHTRRLAVRRLEPWRSYLDDLRRWQDRFRRVIEPVLIVPAAWTVIAVPIGWGPRPLSGRNPNCRCRVVSIVGVKSCHCVILRFSYCARAAFHPRNQDNRLPASGL